MVIFFSLFVLSLFVGGYYLMTKIDRFLDQSPLDVQNNSPAVYSVIISKESLHYDEIRNYFSENNIYCYHSEILDPDIIRECQLSLALSHKDLDNLLFVSQVKHLNPQIEALAVCNNPNYHHLFLTIGVDLILGKNQTPFEIISAMKGRADHD